MISPSEPSAPRATSRGVTATWWYTVSAIVFLELMLVLLWPATLLQAGFEGPVLLAVLVGGLIWCGSTAPLLRAYRHRTGESTTLPWRHTLAPLVIAAAFGVLAFSLTGLWLLLLAPLAQTLQLLDWPRSVRARLVIALTVVLVCLWVVDAQRFTGEPPEFEADPFLYGFFSAALPFMTVLTLWWWDVLIALDRARVSEARLAATQERLRVATDVHDLQGHHLQVIALQLELAERLLEPDPAAALEQLRAARGSVDEARQGTRDLALRFRSVPLRDELANARDLLRAAGIAVETSVAPDADDAPASVFGPVIRETTTNVLRHGGGRSARLSLERVGTVWRYEIRNDVAGSGPEGGVPDGETREGSGLDGIARRAGEAGGALEVHRGDDGFTVVVTAPAGAVTAR
ncbi:histidine kinase [Herbiconiux sp. CPCC 203407]|uniref:Histidine kinase n=1 Tax=Herbiconiux oxytropis TaxID=2970915 RepID=A0AA41XGQ6_9MICO|nr:histidine kinase [Herbiconiux oxytropis]MCS5723893.1 histidine kinase [Herbiconiux oxytropis]MCS5725909.1 histidine kinase [Herbiconiux oxytropis]